MFVTGTEKFLPVLPADAPLLRGIVARAGSVGEVMLLPSEVDRLRALADALEKITLSDVQRVRGMAGSVRRMLDDGAGGIDVLRDMLGVYDSDSNVARLARQKLALYTATADKFLALLPLLPIDQR